MSFWADKTVLVTGSYGFLGTHLVSALQKLDATIIRPKHNFYDLTQRTAVNTLAATYPKVDVVFHLAANVGGIQYNMKNPADVLHDNLMMGMNIMDEAAKYWFPQRVVYAGSVCSYPLYAPVPTLEEHLWGGYPEATNAPYGIAKLVVGEALKHYKTQYHLNSAYLILANMYGPGDAFDPARSHAIPALIRKFTEAKAQDLPSVEIWGSGTASRDFLFVTDAVRALLMAGEKVDDPTPINISTMQETQVFYLAKTIKLLTGYKGEIVFDKNKPEGQPRRSFRNRRASQLLGWQPDVSIYEGLERTVVWYQRYHVGGGNAHVKETVA